jgi:hypothetical protein
VTRNFDKVRLDLFDRIRRLGQELQPRAELQRRGSNAVRRVALRADRRGGRQEPFGIPRFSPLVVPKRAHPRVLDPFGGLTYLHRIEVALVGDVLSITSSISNMRSTLESDAK